MFIEKYLIVVKILNLVLIYAATMVLLIQEPDEDNPLSHDIASTEVFAGLLLGNIFLAWCYFIGFCFKNAPLYLGKLRNNFRKQPEYKV
jgi:hypothetical protein